MTNSKYHISVLIQIVLLVDIFMYENSIRPLTLGVRSPGLQYYSAAVNRQISLQ